MAHDPSILRGLAHGAETAAAPPFVGLVEITLDEDDTTTALATLAAPLDRAGWIDRAASAVVVGPELTVVPGDERIMLAMALSRRAGMSLADFTEYWSTKHADLGRQVPGSEGYRQVHLDTELTSQARELTGFTGPRFDGVALAYYSTEATFQAIMANAEITDRLLEDERRSSTTAGPRWSLAPSPWRRPGYTPGSRRRSHTQTTRPNDVVDIFGGRTSRHLAAR